MKRLQTMALVVIIAGTFLSVLSCSNRSAKESKDAIAVSILPQEYFVSRIAGDQFDILVMIPPGASPATYEPTPVQLTGLSNAKLYLQMGHTGFEMAWMDKLSSANDEMKIFNLSEGVDLIMESTMHMSHTADPTSSNEEEMHDMNNDTPSNDYAGMDHSGHHHGGIDPHTWLSPKNTRIIAMNIYEALSAVYPEKETVFKSNLEAFISDLDSLDRYIESTLTDLSSRAFFTYHPSLSYFARDYQLDQYPLELGGKTPSAAHMKKLIDKGKKENIGVVFLQMQFDQKNAEVLASEINAEIVQINPLDPEWYDQMVFIADQLEKNLR